MQILPRLFYLKRLFILCSVLVTACASTPQTHFYVLEALATVPTTQNITNQRVLGIGPLSLPSLLNRQQIIRRGMNNGVELAEFHQWAEPLKDTVLQVLTKNLTSLQPLDTIRSYPWSAYGNVQYRVIIDISRFDADNKTAVLEASWAIMSEDNHRIIANDRALLKQVLSDDSYHAIAQAMSQLLADFSKQLTLSLGELK
ncbi:MAG: PqiC family protein [Methylococcaceae bacterium]